MWIALIIALVSLHSWVVLPFSYELGSDLQNLYKFHKCEAKDNPYLATGRQCGDKEGRSMYYPPLLYWSFYWLRGVNWGVAYAVWVTFIFLTVVLSGFLWFTSKERSAAGGWELAALWVLLSLSFPVMFAIERGNNDTVVFLLFTLSYIAYRKGQRAISGGILGLAAAYKLYPGIALTIIAASQLLDKRSSRERLTLRAPWTAAVPFIVGATVGTVLPMLLLRDQYTYYFKYAFPVFAAFRAPPVVWSHSLISLGAVLGATALGYGLAAMIGIVWLWALAHRREGRDEDSLLLFAAPIALSTYFSGTSYDYNLMTTYPLLGYLFLTAMTSAAPIRNAAWGLFLLGEISIIGDRSLFVHPFYAEAHILLQAAWLTITGIMFGTWMRQRNEENENDYGSGSRARNASA